MQDVRRCLGAAHNTPRTTACILLRVQRKAIQQLSTGLINRIAAGEVIERPASVVKELVENALDAGAKRIVVEVEDGGRELVRVIDDGSGIPAEQLPLAFAEHATSKLACDEDLFRIDTMGFRGEALASIGSVSHARLLSRTIESEAAYEIFNRGGTVTAAQAAAGNVGTTLEIRNLFYNTPARRKFMKGSATEFGHISDIVLRLALPYPQVSFKLSHNGRVSLDLPAAGDRDRWLSAWPKEFAEQHLPLEVRDAEVRLRGLIGLPETARPTPKYQYVYLNGRHVRDKFITHAAREAFRGLMEPGRHPAVILLLDIPPADVDVNVHPTKIEVRFRDSGRIHGLVLSALREKLLGSDLTPNAVAFRSDADVPFREEMRQRLAAFFKGPGASLAAPLPGASENGSGPAAAAGFDFLPPEPVQGRLPLTTRPIEDQAGERRETQGVGPAGGLGEPIDRRALMLRFLEGFPATPTGPQAGEIGNVERPTALVTAEEASALDEAIPSAQARLENAALSAETNRIGSAPPGIVSHEGNVSHNSRVAQADSTGPRPPSPPARAATSKNSAIQVHNSYLVAETEEGMIIIDQHALHERVMYEELRGRLLRGPLEAQRLLIPATVAATPRQMALLDSIAPLLQRLGVELSPFGPQTLAVHAFPSFLEKLDPAEFVRELLERGEQELLDLHDEELLHEVLDMMACKAAVKAGDPLTGAEIEALLQHRHLVERSSNCPHGRPTTLRLTLSDLEKQFKRTGF
jgi:DNA mismatch repair protein MutL